jgi:hypothetical protein
VAPLPRLTAKTDNFWSPLVATQTYPVVFTLVELLQLINAANGRITKASAQPDFMRIRLCLSGS